MRFIALVLITAFAIFVRAQTDLVWAYSFPSDTGLSCSRIYNYNNDIFICGYFSDSIDADPGPATHTLINSGSNGAYVCKLDANGDLLWAKNFGGNCNAMAHDKVGNIYILGGFFGSADFDPGPGIFTLTATGSFDLTVTKLNSAGDFQWVKTVSGGSTIGSELVIDANNNIYVCGKFMDSADFDPGSGVYNLSSSGDYDGFILKLDSVGGFKWGRSFGNANEDIINSLKLTGNDELICTGTFRLSVDFNPGPGSNILSCSSGSTDAFVLNLDSAGNFNWVRQFSGSFSTRSESMTIDNAGNIVCSGYFSGITDFDPGTSVSSITSNGIHAFVCKLDANGTFQWARKLGDLSFQSTTGRWVTHDNLGFIYNTGYFSGTVDFDPDTSNFWLASKGGRDVYLNVLNPSGQHINTIQFGGPGWDQPRYISLDAGGSIYLTGYFIDSCDVDPDTNAVYNLIARPDTYYDPFILKLNNTVGIKESDMVNSESELQLYPNPASHELNIQGHTQEHSAAIIGIVNSLGQTVSEKNVKIDFGNFLITENIESLSPGLYFVRLRSEKYTIVRKFIKH